MQTNYSLWIWYGYIIGYMVILSVHQFKIHLREANKNMKRLGSAVREQNHNLFQLGKNARPVSWHKKTFIVCLQLRIHSLLLDKSSVDWMVQNKKIGGKKKQLCVVKSENRKPNVDRVKLSDEYELITQSPSNSHCLMISAINAIDPQYQNVFTQSYDPNDYSWIIVVM